MLPVELYMALGFMLSAYAIVANDAIQTLGTFIAANQHRSWVMIWAFSATILSVVLIYGWIANEGDPAYSRLDSFPFDVNQFGPLCLLPPLVLLGLTRFGLPVSTTFLILTFFRDKNLYSMVTKSLMGYALAITLGLICFRAVRSALKRSARPQGRAATWWTVAQWTSTGFLWSQWLIQDLANLFVYFPRESVGGTRITLNWLLFGLLSMIVMQIFIFREGGGKIQQIVNEKSGTSDVREATIISLVYGAIILFFKEYNSMPMSTTWVFLGLLAGREVAYRLSDRESLKGAWQMIGSDLLKATIGLLVSVVIAISLPWLSEKNEQNQNTTPSASPAMTNPTQEVEKN